MNNGTTIRELSSVGSERLPYKQRVGGSTPSAPTKASGFSDAFIIKDLRRGARVAEEARLEIV